MKLLPCMVLVLLTACPSKAELDQQAEDFETQINAEVIQDTLQQLGIVLKNGDPIEICVHTGLVAAAYLQAKDSEGYSRWKANEKRACKSAGM